MLANLIKKGRKLSIMLSVMALSVLCAVPAFATGETPTYDAAWIGEQMTTGFSTAATNIIHYIGLAIIGGLGCFGIVIGVRAALRIFSAVSKGRG